VVVQVTVDESGKVKVIDFLRGMPGFNHLVSQALEKWPFQAASFKGRAIPSKTAIAFVFQSPSSNKK